MSRTLVVFTHKTDGGRGAIASEITQDDLDRGRGGVLGDYYVVEPGQRPQWHERRTFEADWEPMASSRDAADLGPVIDDARAQIDALEPLDKPSSSTPAKELSESDTWRAIAAAGEFAARLEQLEAIVPQLAARVDQLETLASSFDDSINRAILAAADRLEQHEQLKTSERRAADEAAALEAGFLAGTLPEEDRRDRSPDEKRLALEPDDSTPAKPKRGGK